MLLKLSGIQTNGSPDEVREVRNTAAAIREEVIAKVGHCEVCGFSMVEVLQLHHVFPVAKGGTSAEWNLKVLCPNCHKVIHKASRRLYLRFSEDMQKQRKEFEEFMRQLKENYSEEQIGLICDYGQRVHR